MGSITMQKGIGSKFMTQRLYEDVFAEDSKEFVEYYYSEKNCNNIVYSCEMEGEIFSMLHLNPYMATYSECKKHELIHYIVAVATKEKYRKQGYMNTLLCNALADMEKMGEAFTFLMPASPLIYKPYEFAYIYDRKQYCLNEKQLSREMLRQLLWKKEKEIICSISGKVVRILLAQEGMLRELSAAANKMLSRKYDVFCTHSLEYLYRMRKELQAQDGDIFLIEWNGIIEGYFFYADENMFVQEAEDTTGTITAQLFQEESRRQPIIMARILSLKAIGKYITGKSDSILIKITDTVIEKNNGIFEWKINKEGSQFLRKQTEKFTVQISIAELTQLLFGYLTRKEEFFKNINHFQAPFFNEIV